MLIKRRNVIEPPFVNELVHECVNIAFVSELLMFLSVPHRLEFVFTVCQLTTFQVCGKFFYVC
jgi:hypothetical protein